MLSRLPGMRANVYDTLDYFMHNGHVLSPRSIGTQKLSAQSHAFCSFCWQKTMPA